MTRDQVGEVGPLGLTLTKTPSFLELIETTLKARHEPEKFKASTVSVISLQIGSWKVVSSNECNIITKFYYGKQRIVWEILVDGMKRKMEIAWPNISAITATFTKGKADTLEIQLEKPPKFYFERDSPPGRTTRWAVADDFTGGYAQVYKRHFAVFKEGTLEDSHTKLLHSDDRLFRLSQSTFSAFSTSMFFDAVPIEKQHDLVRQQHLFMRARIINAPTDDFCAESMRLARSTPPLQTTPMQEMGVNLSSVQAVSTTPAEDFMSYQPSDSWDDPVNLSHLIPFQATPNFPSVPLEATTMLETGNYLPDNVYATVLRGLPKDVPTWNVGADQNMPTSDYGAQEDQVQYDAPFSGLTGAVIEPPGLVPFCVNERSLLVRTESSFGSSMDAISAQAGALEGFRYSGGDGECSLSDPNLAMVPTVYCPNEEQVLQPASSFMCINDGRPNFRF